MRSAAELTVSRGPSRPVAIAPDDNAPASADEASDGAGEEAAASTAAGGDVPDVPLVDASEIVIAEPPAPPQQLRIGSVDVVMPIASTGVQGDGQMQLPDDPNVIGWYRFGASPGDKRGSAVLGGHVDSIADGVGPLARLASVQVGERVVVTDDEGRPVRYEVTSVQRITKSALDVDVLFRPNGPHQLAVITCGGLYLPDAGGYEDNIVVLARPVVS